MANSSYKISDPSRSQTSVLAMNPQQMQQDFLLCVQRKIPQRCSAFRACIWPILSGSVLFEHVLWKVRNQIPGWTWSQLPQKKTSLQPVLCQKPQCRNQMFQIQLPKLLRKRYNFLHGSVCIGSPWSAWYVWCDMTDCKVSRVLGFSLENIGTSFKKAMSLAFFLAKISDKTFL